MILVTLSTLSVSAQQQIIKREHILENSASLVNGRGEGAFAVEGLKARMDRAESTRRKAARKAPKAVEPMITTLWAQDSPFNRQLPSTGGLWGGTPQTGCVATAMAQILNYFEYPAASTGKGSYSTNGSSWRKVDTKTTFAWDQMLDRYTFGYSDAQMKAVGELMRDCGYCSNMVYTTQGSGTTAYDAGYGISHNMQYDSLSIQVVNRMYYHDNEWKEMVYNELQAGRPVMYDAVDPIHNMGHAFVLDGMSADGKVHVNWGWGGTSNGYYDLDKLVPSYDDPYGQPVSYNFSSEQKMIIGFKPQSTPDADEKYKSFFGMQEEDAIWIENDQVMLKQTPIYNFSHLCFNGMLALVIEGEDGHGVALPFFYSRWENNMDLSFLDGLLPAEYFYSSSTLNDTDGRTPRPDGRYMLYLVSWSKQEMEGDLLPQYVRIPAKYFAENEENIGVWEANIVGGHWDAKSVKRCKIAKEESETGIQSVANQQPTDSPAFNLAGQRVGTQYKGILVKGGKKFLSK